MGRARPSTVARLRLLQRLVWSLFLLHLLMVLAQLRHDLVMRVRTSTALVDECLTRIAELDPRLGAVLALNPQAGSDGAAADEHLRRTGEPLGPLHGIPILVKDVFETRGIPTSFGCRAFRDHVPADDAEVVRRLRSAGAIILGKTATPDFAMSWLSDSSTGINAVNSRSEWHEAGGSSSGSAVAVAAGLAPVALGSDTGGSVRVPASFNGVVGMRPTTGLVPTGGMAALVSMQDIPGPLSTCVDDAAVLLEVLAGQRWDEAPRRLEGCRLGALVFPDCPMGWDGSEQVSAVFDDALARLRSYGVQIVDRVQVPKLGELLRESSPYLVAAREDIDAFLASRGSRSFSDLYEEGVFPDELDLAELLATRSSPGAQARAELRAARSRLGDTVVDAMAGQGLDALVYPSVRVPAPRWDRDRLRLPSRRLPVNTLVASQADLPALTLPAGRTHEGLPVGLELLGRPARDAALLSLARLVEHVLEA
ncbi:amidase [Kribbella sp. NBC_00359]|uniref:amidase n=1 Tax=Kribbella sp. NBC_00359 TaxID=2975966 RepID=UPI002E1CA935